MAVVTLVFTQPYVQIFVRHFQTIARFSYQQHGVMLSIIVVRQRHSGIIKQQVVHHESIARLLVIGGYHYTIYNRACALVKGLANQILKLFAL